MNDGDQSLFPVNFGHPEIRIRRVQAASGAAHFADVVVPHVIIGEQFLTIGADAHIVDDVETFGFVPRLLVNGVIDPPVVFFQTAADDIVRVKDHQALFRQGPVDDIKDIVGMGVAHAGIPGQIGTDGVIRLHVWIDPQRAALVHLQHTDGIPAPVEQVDSIEQTRGNAGGNIAACTVAQNFMPRHLQGVRDHIGGGGLAVGSRHRDDGFRAAHIPQKTRADLQGNLSGQVRSVSVHDVFQYLASKH